MHNFKRMLGSVLGILLVIVLVSALLILPYQNSEVYYYQDKNLRKALAGQIDCVAVGASQALYGVVPAVLDEELGCFSYNLSGSLMTLRSKYYLLSKELQRNPVQTVILEISHDMLSREETSEYAIGDVETIARLDSFAERAAYTLRYIAFDGWLNLYSRELVGGVHYWKEKLQRRSLNNVDAAAKGFYPNEAIDVTLTPEQARTTRDSETVSTDYLDKNVKMLDKIVDLCHSHRCRIVIAVLPQSDAKLWQTDGWDAFRDWLARYASDHDCEVYDLNLVKNRAELFSDQISFSDGNHLSPAGAQTATKLLAQAIRDPEDWQQSVFASYAELKPTLPYAAYLQ